MGANVWPGTESVLCGSLPNVFDIGLTVWWSPGALAFPQHAPETLHDLMMSSVQIAASRGQQLDRLTNAGGLVDAALFADGQVHRQMQKRVFAALGFGLSDSAQSRIQIGEFRMVFGVLGDPLVGQGFDGFHGLAAEAFAVNRAEKAPHVRLGGIEHSTIVPQARRAGGAIGYSCGLAPAKGLDQWRPT